MARRQDDETPEGGAGPADDSIGAATRALADATAALTRLIGKQVQAVVPEVSDAVAASLREASRGLAEASEGVGRRGAGGRAEERRAERAGRTRTELLDAAARAFARQGYEGASLGDIAADAGYTKGAVYAHFGSKHELFLEVARRQIATARVGPGLPDLSDDDLEHELATALDGMVDADRLLLSLEILSFAVRHPESRAEIGAVHEEVFAELADQVGRARHPGSPEPVEADWDTALAVVSVSNIALLLGAVTGSPHASPEAGARVIARLLRG